MGASAEPREASGETLEGGGAPGISRLVLPDGGHAGARVPWVCHTVSHHARQEHVMPLSWYRQRPWGRSTAA